MARTTPAQVKQIIDVLPSEPLALDSFITTANEIVTTKCSTSEAKNPTVYTPTRMELIERWLAAHFFAVNRRRAASGSVSEGAAETKDPAATDLFLDSTLYGQTAIALDTDGNLAGYNNSLSTVQTLLPIQGPRIRWLGTKHHHGWIGY